ncbi:hypothetical protein L7H23_04405 [Sphingopyxis sp. BSN-002]|uniref:hypothetical protein n=1 Tax=Sphingopyxis sp. BSN-002 TaxID=2911495 RepID=UPI001EDC7383|nr:hypothetical protein [Sphingopyxis sp. BSN-002]UKK85357.1 hypothetical protein L7H23_04405 [Sphingopyxis sp. BSN-002]
MIRICSPAVFLSLVASVPAAAGEVAASPAVAPDRAAEAFGELASLAGVWRIADRPDSTLRIRFSLTAGGTVIVESWERAGQPHSLTLYHRDGASLVATHYCPQGNQPRLRLAREAVSGKPVFSFSDATDLDAGESYLHDLRFDLAAPDRIVRSEIYRRGDAAEPSSLVLVREAP